jgi:hypothetical protein
VRVLSFQQYINGKNNDQMLEQIARNMVASGFAIDDTFQFLPQNLNEGFFRRLGAAWHAFWNPDQETFTKEQVGQEVMRQNKEVLNQLQTMQEMLRKKGIKDADIKKMFERMNKHYANVVGSIADTLDHGEEIDKAVAMRSGKTSGGTYTLPKDATGAWDALQKIHPIEHVRVLDEWWATLSASEKEAVRMALEIKYPIETIQGKHLSVRMKEARNTGKI